MCLWVSESNQHRTCLCAYKKADLDSMPKDTVVSISLSNCNDSNNEFPVLISAKNDRIINQQSEP